MAGQPDSSDRTREPVDKRLRRVGLTLGFNKAFDSTFQGVLIEALENPGAAAGGVTTISTHPSLNYVRLRE